jgi:nitrite reductase/ring-hydroxylating ferredoxin subunit
MEAKRVAVLLCDLADLPDPGTKALVVERDGAPLKVFVVHWQRQVYAYVNSCPHVPTTLDWDDGRFLDPETGALRCAVHFALFEIETGYCFRGPCLGKSLTPYPVDVHGTKVMSFVTSVGV